MFSFGWKGKEFYSD